LRKNDLTFSHLQYKVYTGPVRVREKVFPLALFTDGTVVKPKVTTHQKERKSVMQALGIISIAVMVIGLIGMIICSKKQKTNPAMQPVSIGLFVVVLAGAIGLLVERGVIGGGANSVMESELAFLASRGHAAGDYLKKVAPGKKILIIAEPNFDKSAQITAMVDMIKKAYGSQDVTIAAIPVPASTEDNPQPIEEVMKAKDFDKLTDQYKDAGIIISLIGLPSNARSMKAFSANPAPKFFLLSTGIGTGKFVQEQMNKGVIVGAVVPNPKANYDLKAPADPAKAFAIRFVLVTKENLAANKQFFE